MKFFNIEGPIDVQRHYYVSLRHNEQHMQQLIDDARYFALHAPRQSGKTTLMLASVKRLNEEGRYKALYVNIEKARVAENDVAYAITLILKALYSSAASFLDKNDPLFVIIEKELKKVQASLQDVLCAWSESSDKPIVLYIDEIDALVGKSFLFVLSEIRSGYPERPHRFPQSIGLIGLRDVRNYRTWSAESQAIAIDSSPFNIAKSLTLPNFSQEQIEDLYRQHTQETGQEFTDEAIAYAFYLTQGQPWLVNALAHQACLLEKENPITKETIAQAKEILVLQRDTHIGSLINRLQEPRVRDIIDTMISGGDKKGSFQPDDLYYVHDLGLINIDTMTIANPIYQEIIPRELSFAKQKSITEPIASYKNKDGSFNIPKLLQAFTQFYRENSAIWLEKFDYKESGPHLILMAFLQRIINGGGRIHREYALGRGRVDLLVEVPLCNQRVVIELKIKRNENTLRDGLEQTADYMDVNNATEGHLIIFNPTSNAADATIPWSEKIYTNQHQLDRMNITVWGL